MSAISTLDTPATLTTMASIASDARSSVTYDRMAGAGLFPVCCEGMNWLTGLEVEEEVYVETVEDIHMWLFIGE